MQVYSDDPSASAGQYIGTEDDGLVGDRTTGITTYSLTIAEAGAYKIYGRVIGGVGDGSNSFWVRIAGVPVSIEPDPANDGYARWNGRDFPAAEIWMWDDMHNDQGPVQGDMVYTFDPGTYTLDIGYREDGALLDAIAIVLVAE
jgi:hypothetical protein